MNQPDSFFLTESKTRCQVCLEGEDCEVCGGTGYVESDPFKKMDTTPMTNVVAEMVAFHSTVDANVRRSEMSGYELTEEQVSPAEMWLAAAMIRAGIEHEQQYPVGPFFLDFYFLAERLAVEVDGAAYHPDAAKDARRTDFLLANGVRYVLRFAATRVRDDATRCIEEIAKVRELLGVAE